MNKAHFIVEYIDVWADHGGLVHGAPVAVAVAKNLEDGMQFLRDMNAPAGQVRQVFAPRRRADGKVVPCAPDIYPYKKA